MNTVIPQAWIIQEKIRREQEKKRKEEDSLIPISLPQLPEGESFDPEMPLQESTNKDETVIIIDI